MERIRTFNMSGDLAALQSALATGQMPQQLAEPMQALVARITDAASRDMVAIYLCSADEHAGVRDHFAYLLARTLTQHVPSTLLVDCDFLNVGMHGLVPEADALGFLDLLLYGSSLGVITQATGGGVKMIGAGSFPVTKRMPFVMGAFEDAGRRLLNHARCVVFVGPLFEDEGGLHPIIGAVDLPLLVREAASARPGAIDPVEERIASTWDTELASVRLVSPSASAPGDDTFRHVIGDETEEADEVLETPVPPPPSFSDLADDSVEDEEVVDAVPPPVAGGEHPEQPPEEPVPVPFPTATADTPDTRRRRVHPMAVVVAIVAIAAAVWWIGLRDRGASAPGGAGDVTQRMEPPTAQTPPAVADTTPSVRDTVEVAREAAGEPPPAARAGDEEAPVDGGVAEEVVEAPGFVDPADTGGRSGGTVHLNSHDIHVMEDLQRDWADHYFIHISSFRRSVEARDEVAFLESHEFPVFIVFLDLGAKGKWYRVYAGPFATRDEARDVKKSLDDIPRVRFTRITKISS